MIDGSSDTTKVGSPSRPELVKEAPAPDEQPKGPSGAKPQPEPRLPKQIVGGFRAVGEDLERRSREWTNMVRLLEQHRLHLESAEGERDLLYDRLTEIVPDVQESGRSLKSMLETSKSGEVAGELATHFDKNMRALDELEKVATALNVNFLWCRSAWEQYARSAIRAQQMREEYRHALSAVR